MFLWFRTPLQGLHYSRCLLVKLGMVLAAAAGGKSDQVETKVY